MREVDRVAVDEIGLALLSMMENAGRALAWHVWQERGDEPVVVVAGAGGNGGGGLAAARHLRNRGVPVSVVLDRQRSEVDGVPGRQLGVVGAMDVPIRVGLDDDLGSENVVVDALIGYGLGGPLRGTARELVEWMRDSTGPTVSLDVPSGRDATTGDVLGVAVEPDRLVTLALPKTGLTGLETDLWLADIGIPAVVYDRTGIEYDDVFENEDWVRLVTADEETNNVDGSDSDDGSGPS